LEKIANSPLKMEEKREESNGNSERNEGSDSDAATTETEAT
jgi:hypothetical protein